MATLFGPMDHDLPALARAGDAPPPRLPLEPLRVPKPSAWGIARTLLALDRSDIRLAFVYGIAIGVLYIVTPVAVQALVNTIALGAMLQPLLVLTVLVAIVLTFAGVMRILQAHVVEAIQARMFVRAAADVSRRMLSAPASVVERASPAELTARFLEVPVMQKALAILLVDGIDLLLKLFVGMALLAVYHPMLLVFSLMLLILLLIVVVVGGRGALATALEESAAKYSIVAWLEQSVRMAYVVRTDAARRRALDRADQLTRNYRDARRGHFKKLARQLAGSVAIQVIGSAVLLGLGGSLVVAGQLTLGQLVAAELVFASIAFALVKLHKQLEAVYDVLASSKKFAGLVDVPVHARSGERLARDGAMAVRLANVSVAHAARGTVLDALALSIAPGQRVAITGPAGSGKSTLVDTLALQQPVTSGQLVLDGIDARQLAADDVRAQIVLSRDTDLAMIDATIEANLRLARPDADLPALLDALRVVRLEDEIGQLHGALATELAITGRPLSKTATRRLALARSLLAQPRLWLLDGALDDLGLTGDEKARCLDELFAATPATMVIVTADPDVLARCGRQLAIAEGQLVEVA